MRFSRRRRAFCASLIVAVSGLVPGPSGAGEDLETVVTMFSDHDHWSMHGESRTYFPGDHPVAVSGDAEELTVQVQGAPIEDTWEFSFAPPLGGRLSEGTYDYAVSLDERTEERAGLDIMGDGWACRDVTGRFTVRRMTVEPDGTISSLWIVYEHHCEGRPDQLFGEIRYRVPGAGGAAIVSSRAIDWGKVDHRQWIKPLPVRVLNPTGGAIALGDVGVAGPGAGAFRANASDCDGAVLRPGERCTIWMRFLATARGQSSSTLRVAEASGFVHDAALSGFVYGGTTRFVMSSHPDDFVGDGRFYDFKPSGARFTMKGSRRRVDFSVRGYMEGIGESWWDVIVSAPPGEILEIGRTYRNTPDPPYPPREEEGWGFVVEGDHRGCRDSEDEFTVSELEVDRFGDIEEFGLSFVQKCGPGHMRGILDFRDEQPHDPPAPPPFHERLFEVYSNDGWVRGWKHRYDEAPDVCWDRVRVHIYDVTKWPYELMARVRTNRRGSFRWPDPGHDLEVILPVKWLKSGWVCAKVRRWVYD